MLVGMHRKIKSVIAGIVTMAAVPAIGLAAATSADAASGTKDNHVYYIDGTFYPNGYVMWNDYKDSDHSYDLDDIWLTDRADDGKSVSITVYRNGNVYKSAHAYSGDRKKLYLWNVKKGETVS